MGFKKPWITNDNFFGRGIAGRMERQAGRMVRLAGWIHIKKWQIGSQAGWRGLAGRRLPTPDLLNHPHGNLVQIVSGRIAPDPTVNVHESVSMATEIMRQETGDININVISDVTDVFVLLFVHFYHKKQLTCHLMMHTTAKERKVIDIQATANFIRTIIIS